MSPAKQLYDLQRLEVESNRSGKALAVVEASLADTQVVDEAQRQDKEARAALGELQKRQRDLELSVVGLEAQVRGVEEKMYSGATTNSKELQALQADVRMLRRHQGEEEEKLLELMLQVEQAQRTLSAAEEHLRSIRSTWEADHEGLIKELERLRRETTDLQELQGEEMARITPQELDLYRSLKASRGQAISKVEGGICRACGLSLPSHELQRARTSKELVRCSSCGRLLYVS